MPQHISSKEYKKSFFYINSLFLDSGAFSLSRTLDIKNEEIFYESKEFYKYMNDYVSYIKKYKIAIDIYANIDVIGNPELTWKNQQYLENKGIKPLPVVHLGSDMKWISHYINKGYEYIALGGLAGSLDFKGKKDWLDEAFFIICSNSKKLPKVKIHGFGMQTFSFLFRYPWWSIDSTTWSQTAAYGGITVPYLRKNKFMFSKPPRLIKISDESIKSEGLKHFASFSIIEKKTIQKWLEWINVPLGSLDEKGEIVEEGVSNKNWARNRANILYIEKVNEIIPKWPWSFNAEKRKTLLC